MCLGTPNTQQPSMWCFAWGSLGFLRFSKIHLFSIYFRAPGSSVCWPSIPAHPMRHELDWTRVFVAVLQKLVDSISLVQWRTSIFLVRQNPKPPWSLLLLQKLVFTVVSPLHAVLLSFWSPKPFGLWPFNFIGPLENIRVSRFVYLFGPPNP